MDKSEIEKNIGKCITTPCGKQLLAGYQLGVLMQNRELKVYPDNITLFCYNSNGGFYHHNYIDCKTIEEV